MKLSERAKKIIRLTLSIATLVMLSVSAVLFVISSISINAMGASPYTYETIGAAFRRIAIPVYITLALVVISGVTLTLLIPEEKGRAKAMKDAFSRLNMLYRIRGIGTPKTPTRSIAATLNGINSLYANLDGADEGVVKTVKYERTLRSSMKLTNVILFVLGVIVALVIGITNKSLYLDGVASHDLTQSVVNVVVLVVICLAPAMAFAVIRFFVDRTSAVREYLAVETLPRTRVEKDEENEAKFPTLLVVRISVLVLAVVFIILGIFNGGMEDVVQKAIKICTECIGLG